MSPGKLFVAVLAALVGLGGVAQAAQLRYEAPAPCPSRERFAEEVSARLGFSPWDESGATMLVRIHAEDASFVGQLAPQGAFGAGQRRFVADSCRKVTDLLVTAAAITLDRREPPATAAAAAAPAAAPAATPANPPAAARPRREAPRRAASAAQPRTTASSSSSTAAPSSSVQTIAPGGQVIPPGSPASDWAFAERNNRFQLGAIFVSSIGFGITGNIPVWKGHVQATYARLSSDDEFGTLTNQQVHAYFLVPVFYINEGSSFEVPLFAGGGFAYDMYSFDQKMGTDVDKTAVLPVLAGGMALQFRRFPVEFLSQMTISLVKGPNDPSYIGFNFAIRYVFGRD